MDSRDRTRQFRRHPHFLQCLNDAKSTYAALPGLQTQCLHNDRNHLRGGNGGRRFGFFLFRARYQAQQQQGQAPTRASFY
jgi:hypothetical protein